MSTTPIFDNIRRMKEKFVEEHATTIMYLVIEPQMLHDLIKEIGWPFPESLTKHALLLGMMIVVVPIPELLYIAGSPGSELYKDMIKRAERISS
jgi:hypothetical protein